MLGGKGKLNQGFINQTGERMLLVHLGTITCRMRNTVGYKCGESSNSNNVRHKGGMVVLLRVLVYKFPKLSGSERSAPGQMTSAYFPQITIYAAKPSIYLVGKWCGRTSLSRIDMSAQYPLFVGSGFACCLGERWAPV
jgi:hypothetical protein